MFHNIACIVARIILSITSIYFDYFSLILSTTSIYFHCLLSYSLCNKRQKCNTGKENKNVGTKSKRAQNRSSTILCLSMRLSLFNVRAGAWRLTLFSVQAGGLVEETFRKCKPNLESCQQTM
uniref:Uncharacterized protein n=1 Tax=Cacopsylla melanoneura TaxID=428564 RepID=A0A8D8VTW4_9HEMI